MKIIISSTSERYGRCGFVFKRSGTEFELLEGEHDKRDAVPVGIGRHTYAVLEGEARRGKLSILPASQAEALESRESASERITQLEGELSRAVLEHASLLEHAGKLEGELSAARARIAELEAAAAKKTEAKGEAAKK